MKDRLNYAQYCVVMWNEGDHFQAQTKLEDDPVLAECLFSQLFDTCDHVELRKLTYNVEILKKKKVA